MISLVLVGAAGRMGRAVEQAALAGSGFTIKGRVDRAENFPAGSGVWSEDPAAFVARGDVVIEFSTPAVCRDVANLCASRGAALVSGTTGLGADEDSALGAAAK